MSSSAASPLPTLYARWARELLGADPPFETRATCFECAMAPAVGAASGEGVTFFDPRVKCCTYTPDLPNFLAGAILADTAEAGAEGRASLLARIEARENVTPLAIARPSAVDAVYSTLAPDRFGTDPGMRCPHMTSDHLCGIWMHRNAVCSTWFCKHERGRVGERFWDHLRTWLRGIEHELAVWSLLEAGFDSASLAVLLAPDRPAGRTLRDVTATRPSAAWGRWSGREADLYVECWTRVERLSWNDVARACGAATLGRARVVEAMFARLTDESLPPRLVQAPLVVLQRKPDSSIVLSYRGTDLLELETDALTVVSRFDGRPTSDVLRGLEDDDDLVVDPELVSYLRDFDVLRDPADD
jgi:hypothetical protein